MCYHAPISKVKNLFQTGFECHFVQRSGSLAALVSDRTDQMEPLLSAKETITVAEGEAEKKRLIKDLLEVGAQNIDSRIY